MLPKGWTVRYSKSHQNRPYYFNELTGATQWEPPAMEEETTASSGVIKCHAYHLLLKHAGSRRPASWRQDPITLTEGEALEECRQLRAEIYSNPAGVFEGLKAVARVRSDCSSAKRDGDLGYFGRGEMQSKVCEISYQLPVI